MLELNNREIALATWLCLALVATLFIKGMPKTLLQLLQSFFQFKIQAVLACALLYVAACAWLLKTIHFWEIDNLKTTIMWSVTFAFITLFDIQKLTETPKSLRKLAYETVAPTAIIVFVAEFHSFPLWVELLMFPVLAYITAMVAVSGRVPNSGRAVSFLNTLLAIIGFSILAYSTWLIVSDFEKFGTWSTFRDFLVPIFLTFLFLPFLYMVILYSTYETATLRLNFMTDDEALRRYVVFRGLLSYGHDLERFRRLLRNLGLHLDLPGKSGERTGLYAASWRAMLSN